MTDQIPAWILALRGVPLPELQPVTLAKEQILLPPHVKFTGVAYPVADITDGVERMYLITVEMPTGVPYPKWTQGFGSIRLNRVYPEYLATPDGMVSSSPGFQLLGPPVSEARVDWSVSEESTHTAFFYYTVQLHALMQKAKYFAERVLHGQPGQVFEETWGYVDPADYYELKLLFMFANFARHNVSASRYMALDVLEAWWYNLYNQFRGIQSVVGIQIREAIDRNTAAILRLADAKPSF